MRQFTVLWGALLWVGLTSLLSSFRSFRTSDLQARIRPYLSGVSQREDHHGDTSVLALTFLPLLRELGTYLSRIVGVKEDLSIRLARIHSPVSPTQFRVRQSGWALIATCLALLFSIVTKLPIALTAILCVSGTLLAFLLSEWNLLRKCAQWQHATKLEIPIVAEQIGMLLSAGHSMSSAIQRVAQRANGTVAKDLRLVSLRIGQGLTESAALQEWATISKVTSVERLVSVLNLDRESGDLGRMISAEARSARADIHRELMEDLEKRAQKVWIPVTVATLVPGMIFLAIPFIEALKFFSAS